VIGADRRTELHHDRVESDSVPEFVAILEDCPQRIVEMRACLSELLRGYEAVFFDNAGEMMTWLAAHLGQVVLISLDHDLPLRQARDGRTVDPGTGRQVADYLATQPAVCPVIIHSSNDHFAPGMLHALADNQWPCRRIYPFDEHSWVRTAWAAELRRLISKGWIQTPSEES
jgi:hypothetical protein